MINKIGNEPPSYSEQIEQTLDTKMERDESLSNNTQPPHPPWGLPPEAIFETQFNPNNIHKGSVYNEILASIGLNSPISSREERGRN